MRCSGSHSLLSPAGGRPTGDAQELRRATSRSALVLVRLVASDTSASARHISCAKGASSGRQPEKGAAHVEQQRHPRPARSHNEASAHRLRGSALARVALEPARYRVSAAGSRSPGRSARGAACARRALSGATERRSPDSYWRTSPLLSETVPRSRGTRPSAVGEVELPHRRARATRPPRDREKQGDAGRPHAPHGTHQAAVAQSRKLCARATSLTAEGGLRGDKPSARTQAHKEETATRVSSSGRSSCQSLPTSGVSDGITRRRQRRAQPV